MKFVFAKFISIAIQRLPGIVSLFLTLLFFLFVSGYSVEEKSTLDKLFATGTGFFGGMVGGGIIGWLVGGFGVVAMGTGVGVGALGAIAVGGAIGAIFGGLTGASFSFVQMLQNPSDFHVNWIGLPITLLASICLFFILRLALQKMPILMRRSVDREA